MNLHIISKSPQQYSALYDALPLLGADDRMLLIDDGVYAALANTAAFAQIVQSGCLCLALEQDLHTRGIKAAAGINTINMQDFVALVFTADKTVSWY